MSYHEELSPSTNVKKLPEGSKAEKIRSAVEARLAEVNVALASGHPSIARLELAQVGQNIVTLFDELLGELPDDVASERRAVEHSVSAEDLEAGPVVIGDNRSARFWEIDSEIEVLLKKFNTLYEEQSQEPEIQTSGTIVLQDKPTLQ